MDKINAMQTFVAIVDAGSLTGASVALGRSLPTVVRTLAMLEGHLGTRLLRRTTRRMSLTPEGQGYLERCRRILSEIDEAELSVTAGQTEPRGRIRMTAPVLFGHLHVAPAINEFLTRFADVELELILLDRMVHLVEEGFDLGVRIAPLSDSSMIAVPLGHMRRVVCASPALLNKVGAPTHPQALADLPCVRFADNASADTWSFVATRVRASPGAARRTTAATNRELSVRISGPLMCNNAQTAAQACADGLGFGMFLSYQVEPLVRDRQLVVILDSFEPAPIPVSLVYPGSRLVSTRLRALVDWLAPALRERPELL